MFDKQKGHRVSTVPFIAFTVQSLADQLQFLRNLQHGTIFSFDTLVQIAEPQHPACGRCQTGNVRQRWDLYQSWQISFETIRRLGELLAKGRKDTTHSKKAPAKSKKKVA
jgi:hypothetical protein